MDNAPKISGKFCFVGMTLLDGGDAVLDGALVIDGGKIIGVGTRADMLAQHKNVPTWDATGYLAIPGLINAHTHAPMGFFRGLGHGRESMIETFMFPAEKSLTPELIEPLAYSYIYAALLSGTTCLFDHYYFSAGVAKALDRFGMRGVVGETTCDLGGAFTGPTTLERAKDLIAKWPFSSRVRPCLAPHAGDTVSRKLMQEIAAIARSEQLPVHMHLSQTAGERDRVQKREKQSPVVYAAECGILGPKTLTVHLVTADDQDLRILADKGVTAGFCPVSQVIYEKLAPIEGFHRHKIPVALGTDCAASNDGSDMLAEMRMTGILLRHEKIAEESFSPKALFSMTTTHPARVMGLPIGALAVGMDADVVFLKCDLSVMPMHEPLTNLIYSFSSHNVRHVLIDGRWVLWNRELVSLSEADMREQYAQAVRTIQRKVFPERPA